GFVELFRYSVHNTAIGTRRNLPVKGELKVAVLAIRYEVAPTRPRLRRNNQGAVDDAPDTRKLFAAKRPPASRGLAVKQELPAVLLLLLGERVRRPVVGVLGSYKRRNQQQGG